MGIFRRGIKNAFRNSLRTISIVFILAISISMALVMLMSLKTVQGKINDVKSSTGNTITVTPAGVRGFEGGGELLTEDNASTVSSIPHVSKVVKILSDRLSQESTASTSSDQGPMNNISSGGTTSLQSAIEPGSFGERQQRSGINNSSSSNKTQTSTEAHRSFSMPITVTGTSEVSAAALTVSSLNITSGNKFETDSVENVALVGTTLASKNSLSVGSTFTAYNNTITVVGIYDTGNNFSNANLVMPIKTVQKLSDQSGEVNSLIVQTDSMDNLSATTAAIKDKLGSDKVDVTSSEETTSNTIKPLENIKTISMYSLVGSLVAGAVIIFLTMVMIVRERRREIGVLKAIGASNIVVTAQFVIESITLTVISSVIGVIAGIAFSNPILKVLVNNAESSTTSVTGVPGSGPMQGAGRMIRMGIGGAQNAVANLHTTVGYEILIYGFLAALAIAIIGSAIPAFLISKVRPAEAMRSE